MFKRILVALDRSSEAAMVLDSALSIAEPGITEMLLVHFVDWQMQNRSPWIGIATLYDVDISGERHNWGRNHLKKEIEIVDDWLKTLVEKADKFDVDCKYESHIGNCNLGIGDRARDWGADVLVIGRRGHKNISELLLGSVSNYVVHHAPCSILVVQGNKTADMDELSIVGEVNS